MQPEGRQTEAVGQVNSLAVAGALASDPDAAGPDVTELALDTHPGLTIQAQDWLCAPARQLRKGDDVLVQGRLVEGHLVASYISSSALLNGKEQ